MNDTTIKLILGGQLTILTLVWIFTNPYPLLKHLKEMVSPRFLVSAGLETIMALQLFDMLHFQLAFLNFWIFNILGVLITTSGLILAVWAKFTMKRNWGVPAQHDISKQTELVTSGPFAFSRNPIYVGLMLFYFGFELAMDSSLIILTIPLFFLIRQAIIKEEELLEQYFDKRFLSYKEQVPRFFSGVYSPNNLTKGKLT